MVFAECVLAYIDKESIINLLTFLKQKFSNLAVIDYEMFNPNDPFGRMMDKNFKDRGCPLYGLKFFDSFNAIKTHYNSIFGANEGEGEAEESFSFEIYDMNQASKECLDQEEYQR